MRVDDTQLGLAMAFLHYVGCLACTAIAFGVESRAGLALYLCAGIYLNRKVLRKLIYWPEYATAAQQAGDKVRHLALWPLAYLATFGRVFAVRVL